MKTYHLRLVTDDFVKGDSVWTSGVLDFYDNYSDESEMATPSYRNYSTIKSNYGLDLLGNKTFVGLEMGTIGAATPTELGRIEDGRFIDESGRIDVVQYSISFSNLEGTAPVSVAVDLYTSPLSDEPFPDLWAKKEGAFGVTYLGEISSYRYGKVVIRPQSDQALDDTEFELILEIRVGEPLQGNIAYRSIRESQKAFPEWMDIRELENQEPADPSMATPTSVGGQVMNAVAGEWLDEIRGDLAYTYAQKFINTADLTQTAWVYAASNVAPEIYSIVGDDVELARCSSLRDFYDLTDDEDGFWYNDTEKILFCNKDYDNLQVNYEEVDLFPHAIWNWFDEFGLSVDLRRHKLETNASFKARILDVFINRPGVGIDAFKLALRRELNLWQYFTGDPNATPDSAYQGATPEVLEIPDLELHSDFVDVRGVPTKKFRDLVEELARTYPSTWGFFKWGQASWDAGGQEGEGYDVLANVWDATPLSDPNTQSGVGDGNDLFVYRPDDITGAREFSGRLKIRGRNKTTRTEARKLNFDVNIWGEAPYDRYTNPEVGGLFTIKIEADGGATPAAGGTIYHLFTMRAVSDVSAENPTETVNSWSEYRFMSDAGEAIIGSYWYGSDDLIYQVGLGDFQFSWSDVLSFELHSGWWNGSTYDEMGLSTGDWTVWLSNDDGVVMHAGESIVDPEGRPTAVIMSSQSVEFSEETWTTDKQRFAIELNGALPDQTLKDFTVPLPQILWPATLTGDKVYKVQIATREDTSSSARGAFTLAADNSVLFIPDTYILANGLGAWVDGVQEFDDSTEEFVFSSTTAATPAYPVPGCPIWNFFEASQDTDFEGVVDENGPWRNGVAPLPGNSNYNLVTLEVERADFGIPNSEDYVVTWMGVETDNDRVLVWLDANTVKSAIDDSTTFIFPENSVIERYESGDYLYGPIIVRARLNSVISPRWEPQVQSGWFYDRNSEYYMYSIPADETATVSSTHKTLDTVARMGAPIIVKTDQSTPYEYRQVAFWDEATPGYTMYTKQVTPGTGENSLFVAYEDVYDVSVIDLSTNLAVAAATYTTTNEITTSLPTSRDRDYEVTYKVNKSFFADHDYIGDDNTQRTNLVFDDTLATPVTVTYETSKFDPATPVDLALNTFYTIMDEGYIFISHNEYELTKVEVKLSPSTLIADGEDYLMVSLRSLDEHGNPKPGASFTLSTSFGTLSDTSVTTDDDGFVAVKLTAGSSSDDLTGTITITGDVSATVTYQVTAVNDRAYRITAVPNVQQIPADGTSTVYVFGKVEDTHYEPVPYAIVYWRKGRYMRDIWTQQYSRDVATPGSPVTSGMVLADDEGVFTVGPFLAATPGDPGYWMLAVESEIASPHYSTPGGYGAATPNWPANATPTSWDNVGATPDWDLAGDVVFWVEYPHYQHGVENLNGLPRVLTQLGERPEEIPDYASPGYYTWPAFYDEATPYGPATPISDDAMDHFPGQWYAIDRYKQYQMGLLGTNRVPETAEDLARSHPDYRKY